MALSERDLYVGTTWNWHNLATAERKRWVCGYCGEGVAGNLGYKAGEGDGGAGGVVMSILICPYCKGPTFFTPKGKQVPESLPGKPVENVPEELYQLYHEARSCVAAAAYTASVLTCRKMLMNIAVDKGAPEGKNFLTYVEYLSDQNYVPPDGKGWVDYIRTRGNEANHVIDLMKKEDAEALIDFVGALLQYIYELPSKIPDTSPDTSTP